MIEGADKSASCPLASTPGLLSLRSAECYCCQVGHVIPGTTTRIPCDRQIIGRLATSEERISVFVEFNRALSPGKGNFCAEFLRLKP